MRAMLGSDDTFTSPPQLTVRPFDLDKLKVVHRGHSVVPIVEPLLSPEARALVDDPENQISRGVPDECNIVLLWILYARTAVRCLG